jgi:hypothetical protein
MIWIYIPIMRGKILKRGAPPLLDAPLGCLLIKRLSSASQMKAGDLGCAAPNVIKGGRVGRKRLLFKFPLN